MCVIHIWQITISKYTRVYQVSIPAYGGNYCVILRMHSLNGIMLLSSITVNILIKKKPTLFTAEYNSAFFALYEWPKPHIILTRICFIFKNIYIFGSFANVKFFKTCWITSKRCWIHIWCVNKVLFKFTKEFKNVITFRVFH